MLRRSEVKEVLDAFEDAFDRAHFTTMYAWELRSADIDLTDTEHFLYVKLPDNASFLTLAVTDSADGIDSDRGYFASPFLLFKTVR